MKLILVLIFIFSSLSQAADYDEENIHKNDSKWLQFNLMTGVDNKIPFGKERDTYLETEFGGRSGIIDIYGFVDVLDIFDTQKSDFHNGDNLFFKLVPRFSLDGLTGHNLAVGPVKEWYIATQMSVADRAFSLHYIGIGTDLDVPWFGQVGANLMARYVRENYGAANERKWDGYLLSIFWFKPFYNLSNKGNLTYQGYLYYTFSANEIADSQDRSNSSIEWYNGLYWRTDHYAVGYALKYYKDTGLFRSGGIAGETSGIGQYFTLSYTY